MQCEFCKNWEDVEHRMLICNELACAFLTHAPITEGHVLVIPVRCVAKFEDMTDQEKIAIFDLMTCAKEALQRVFLYHAFNHAWNEGWVAGQSVPHFHLHIVPRKEGDGGISGDEVRKLLYRPGERSIIDTSDLDQIVQKIKGGISV